MDLTLRLFLLISVLIYLLAILMLIKREQLNLKYSLLWLASAVVMLIFVALPDIIYDSARVLGVSNPVNFVFILEGMFVILILLSVTVIVSRQNLKQRRLTQTIAILQKQLNELTQKNTILIENERKNNIK